MQNPSDSDSDHAADAVESQGDQHALYAQSNTMVPIETPVGSVYRFKDEELPFRYRLSTFQDYEPFIAQAIMNGSVEVNPAPLRTTTFAARARDAILAKKKFNWPATFTTLELEEADLTVRHGVHTVLIMQRAVAPRKVGLASLSTIKNTERLAALIVDRTISAAELDALVVLLSGRLIAGPVIIKSDTTLFNLDRLEATYDVAITRHGSGETVLI